MGFGSKQTRSRRSPLRAALAFATAAGLALGGLTIGASASYAKGGLDDIFIQDDDLRTYLNRILQSVQGVARADNADITADEAAAFPSTRQIILTPGGLYNTGEISSLVGLEHFVQVDDISLNDQPITDLSPLRGLSLDVIDISGTQVTALPAGAWSGSLRQLLADELPSFTSLGDLTAYSALKMVTVIDSGISSLAGLPAGLESLQVGSSDPASPSPIHDLSPLQNGNLTNLVLGYTKVGDVSPLQGHPLQNGFLALGGEIIDLSPIEDGVRVFALFQTAVAAAGQVDAPFANPVKDVDGSAIAVTSTDAGFSFNAAANTWRFSTPGVKTLSFSASDANGEYFSGTITQTVTEGVIVPPAAGPQIVGTPKVGEQLSVDAGTWQPSDVTLSYEWLVDGAVVATGPTFTPQSSHEGKALTLRATATKTGYQTNVVTTTPVTIAAANPTGGNSGTPGTTGTSGTTGASGKNTTSLEQTGASGANIVLMSAAAVLLLTGVGLGSAQLIARRRIG